MQKKAKVELLFLGISKSIIMLVMGAAFVLAVFAGLYGIYQWNQDPADPIPAKTAQRPTVPKEGFLKEYFRIEDADDNKAHQSKDDQTDPVQSQDEVTVQPDLYHESFDRMTECVKDVLDKIKHENQTEFIKDLDYTLSRVAKVADSSNNHGAAYIKDSVDFTCTIIQDSEVINNYSNQPAKFYDFLIDVLNHHLGQWNRINEENSLFEQSEQDRVAKERSAEQKRVAEAKRNAIIAVQFALSSIGLFMILALYLIFSSIESNLRHINNSISKLNTTLRNKKDEQSHE